MNFKIVCTPLANCSKNWKRCWSQFNWPDISAQTCSMKFHIMWRDMALHSCKPVIFYAIVYSSRTVRAILNRNTLLTNCTNKSHNFWLYNSAPILYRGHCLINWDHYVSATIITYASSNINWSTTKKSGWYHQIFTVLLLSLLPYQNGKLTCG